MPRAVLRALLCLAIAAVPAAAQRDGCTRFRPRVERLAFEGNRSITSFDLTQILYTERAGRLRRWFGWDVGPTACLDTLELRRDERRIAAWYGMRGYPGTTASADVRRTSPRTAHVTFTVREAPPVVIDTVRLANVPRGLVDQSRLLQALRGAPLDDSVLVATMDSVQQILRTEGYARARPPTRTVSVDSAARRARVTLTFAPGNLVRVGAIEVAVTPADSGKPALREDDLRELLRF